jgi:hypothetical protein
MENGSVYEYDAPVLGKYDTTKSYLIESYVNVKKFTFKSIKSRLRVINHLIRILSNIEFFTILLFTSLKARRRA